MREAVHDSDIFAVELFEFVMRDDPNRAQRLTRFQEDRKNQAFYDWRLRVAKRLKAAAGI